MTARLYRGDQRGFHMVELLIVLVVLAVLAFVGFRLWSANQMPAAKNTAATTDAAKIPEIHTATDLDKASEAVDTIDTTENSHGLDALEKEVNSLE